MERCSSFSNYTYFASANSSVVEKKMAEGAKRKSKEKGTGREGETERKRETEREKRSWFEGIFV